MAGSVIDFGTEKPKSNDSKKEDGYVVAKQVETIPLTPNVIAQISNAVKRNNYTDIREVFCKLHYADQATVLESVCDSRCDELIHIIKDVFDPRMLVALMDPLRHKIIKMLGFEFVGNKLEQNAPEDAVDFLNSFSRSDQIAILKSTNLEKRQLIRKVRNQPEDSAGSIMDPTCVVLKSDITVGEAIVKIKDRMNEEEATNKHRLYEVFVSENGQIIGAVEVTDLLITNESEEISTILKRHFISVHTSDTKKQVVAMFNKYDLSAVLVLNAKGEVVGTITIDTIKYIADESAENEIMKLSGSSNDLAETITETTKTRFLWLFINFVTTAVAASIISLFEDVIHHYTMLATWLPIVVSMGTTAGSQSSIVTIRAIATDKMNKQTFKRYFSRETLVSAFNSIAFALVCGGCAFFLYKNSTVALVIGATVGVAILVSVFGGVMVPLAMRALKLDPAITTSVFLTTMAEASAFFVLLTLAKLFFA